MRKRMLRWVAVVIAVFLVYIIVSIATSLNTRAGSYDYSAELPKPGLGVDIRNDGLAMRGFIAWNKFYNNIASSAWKAPEGVTKSKITIETQDGTRINCYVLEPSAGKDAVSATMLYCHGGAFFMPILPSSLECAAWYARELGCRVFMPEYRLTPGNPYPVPINDCYDALRYVASLPETDPDRVILYGESAGGCLCAETLNMCLDEGLLKPAAQMLIYPVTDSAQHYDSLSKYAFTTWSQAANLNMWKLYLNERAPETLDYAVPMLRDGFSDYPPVYVEPSEMDALCDQAVAYAEKLGDAGVDVTMRVVEGAYHGFDGAMDSPLVQRVLAERIEWLRTNLEREAL